MGLGNAPEGGGDYLKRDEWLEMAAENALVVARPLVFQNEVKMEKGMVNPVVCDLVVVTGAHKGTVLRSTRLIGRGQTEPLRKFPLGEDMAACVQTAVNGAVTYAALNPCTPEQYAQIEKLFQVTDNDPYTAAEKAAANAAPADEPPF